MLYVIEGCDATGKTTLAEMLSLLLNAQIVHCTTKTPNNFKFFNELIYAARDCNIIADRFCYGQFVYQDEWDRPLKPDMTDKGCPFADEWEVLYDLETHMLSQGTKLIYTWADIPTIKDRMRARGENPADIEGSDVETLLAKYNSLWKRTLIQPIYFKT